MTLHQGVIRGNHGPVWPSVNDASQEQLGQLVRDSLVDEIKWDLTPDLLDLRIELLRPRQKTRRSGSSEYGAFCHRGEGCERGIFAVYDLGDVPSPRLGSWSKVMSDIQESGPQGPREESRIGEGLTHLDRHF